MWWWCYSFITSMGFVLFAALISSANTLDKKNATTFPCNYACCSLFVSSMPIPLPLTYYILWQNANKEEKKKNTRHHGEFNIVLCWLYFMMKKCINDNIAENNYCILNHHSVLVDIVVRLPSSFDRIVCLCLCQSQSYG